MLPFAYYAASLVPGLLERYWHAWQLAKARIEAITDETLLSAHGHPIGVRFTYRSQDWTTEQQEAKSANGTSQTETLPARAATATATCISA